MVAGGGCGWEGSVMVRVRGGSWGSVVGLRGKGLVGFGAFEWISEMGLVEVGFG